MDDYLEQLYEERYDTPYEEEELYDDYLYYTAEFDDEEDEY